MAIGATSAFRPTGTVALNVTPTSSSVALAGGGESVVVTNNADALAFVLFGSHPAVSAGPSDMPILPRSQIIIGVNSLITHAAAIIQSGAGQVLFTRGNGSFV